MSALCGEITRGVVRLERQRTSTVDHHGKEDRRGVEGRGQASREGTRIGTSVAQSRFLAPELTSSSLLLSHHPSLQVTLSYGVFENKLNVIELSGPFSPQEDPSRYGA